MKLSIIIPIYNEEKTIAKLLEKVRRAKLPNNIKKEIIVVDDASKDNSKLIIQNSKIKGLKIVNHKENSGKGTAVRSGLQLASGNLVIIQDADLEYDPGDYAKLLEPIIKGDSQVVYGTRLKNYPLKLWGDDKTVLPTHLIANRLLTTLTNILYGSNLTDMETCYKVFTHAIIKKIKLKSNRFEIEPEITAKFLKKGIKIIEVPIKTNPRTYQEGKKIGFRDGISAIWTLFKYKFTD